jgi:predicted metal-dependent hydrolase
VVDTLKYYLSTQHPQHYSLVRFVKGDSYIVLMMIGKINLEKTEAFNPADKDRIFDAMQTQSHQSTTPRDIAESLEYVAHYYPSGTKQEAGSRLDRVVERHRKAVVRDIVEHLRSVTKQDFGERPEPWIEKYVKR